MTQEVFAQSLGTSVQWISRVERGEENLTLATLIKLTDALGMKVADLFDEE